jgi:hypothetical protein
VETLQVRIWSHLQVSPIDDLAHDAPLQGDPRVDLLVARSEATRMSETSRHSEWTVAGPLATPTTGTRRSLAQESARRNDMLWPLRIETPKQSRT